MQDLSHPTFFHHGKVKCGVAMAHPLPQRLLARQVCLASGWPMAYCKCDVGDRKQHSKENIPQF